MAFKPTTKLTGTIDMADRQSPSRGQTLFDMQLPLPVSCNAMHTISRSHGGIILSSECRRYYYEMSALLVQEWGRNPIQGRLAAEVWLYENDLRRRDINNYIKTLMDAMQGFVFIDDSQIDETHVYRADMRSKPGVRVRIKQLEKVEERIPMKELEKKRAQADAEHARKKQANGVLSRAANGSFVDSLKVFQAPTPTPKVRQKAWPARKGN